MARAGPPADAAASRAAQRLLATLFAAPCASGVASLAAPHAAPRPAAGDALLLAAALARDAGALAAVPDACARSAAPPPKLLRHVTFSDAVATHALAAVAADRGAAPFAAALLARLARRGAATEAAGAAMRAALSGGAPVAAAAATLAAVADAAALEKLAESLLRCSAKSEQDGDAALRLLLCAPLWASPPLRLLLADKLLTRRPLPRAALRRLLRLVVLEPPAPPPLAPGAAAEAAALDAAASLRSDAMLAMAGVWGSTEFVAGADARLHAYVTAALVAALQALPRHHLDAVPSLLPPILAGVTERLASPVPAARAAGMRVAAALSLALAPPAEDGAHPTQPALFPEALAAPPEAGDEWGGNLWADPDDAGQTAEAASVPLSGPDAAAASSGDDVADLGEDDPDAPFVPARGSGRRAASDSSSEASYDSDDASSDGRLSPYALSDVEDGGGPDNDGATAVSAGAAPTSVRDLAEGLRSDNPDTVEAALHGAAPLLRAAPAELAPAAAGLGAALLSASPPSPDAAAIDASRADALLALLVAAPGVAAPPLAALLTSEGLDTGQRLLVLRTLAAAAQELSSVAPPAPPALPPGAGIAADASAGGAAGALALPEAPKRRGKTRLFAPASLARRAAGGGPAPRANRFAAVAEAFLAPLLAALASGDGAAARDPLVRGRALATAGACIACAARSPAAARLAPAMLAMLAAAPGGSVAAPQPYVRRAALYAAAAALHAMPPGAAAAAAGELDSTFVANVDILWCVSSCIG